MNAAPLVQDVMTRHVLSAPLDASVFEVENATRRASVHRVVVSDHGRPLGVVCRCALAAAQASLPVWRAMRMPAITVEQSEGLSAAAALMRENRIGCLPVVDRRGRLAGIVTRRDLRRAGLAEREIGSEHCAACGTTHDLPPADPDAPVFCGECLERARGDLSFELYGTLGGGG